MTDKPFLRGFDPKWSGVEDYILGITHEIWEDRHIDRLDRYYGKDLIVRSPASIVQGNQGIAAATTATLAEFPDRELPGEDVIWTPTGPDSFLSSHRLICTATHLGQGMYGAPTGRKLIYRILADCWCKDNAVHDEWLVRDQAAIVLQMGEQIVPWVRDLIDREGGPENCVQPFRPAVNIAGPYQGTGNKTEFGAEFISTFKAWLDRGETNLDRIFASGVLGFYPAYETRFGRSDCADFWNNLRSALPDAEFMVHHVIDRQDPTLPRRLAMRWSLDGTHSGVGRFGQPSGAALHILGMSHFEIGPKGVTRDYTLIDDTAVWKQILLATGDL